MRKKLFWSLSGLALFAVACSGGQSVAPVPAQIPQSARSQSNVTQHPLGSEDESGPLVAVTASVVVTVPSSASAAKSISIKVSAGGPVIANLSSTSPGCSGTNPLVCTLSVSATTGSDVFAFKTFNGSNGTGSVLASGTVLQMITTTSKTVHITLAGTPKGITLALKQTGPFECNGSATIQLFVMVMDSAANVIIGGYGESVALTDSDTSGNASLSLTSVSSSASTVNVKYNGHPITAAVFSASASGVPPSAVHPATLKPVQLMFVSGTLNSPDNDFLFVFPPTANGNQAPLRAMSDTGNVDESIFTFYGVAIDSACKLYVSSAPSSAIFEYSASAAGNVSPSATITGNNTKLSSGIRHLAVDTSGNLYAVNASLSGTGPQAVEEFAAGATGNAAPIAIISGNKTGFNNPSGIAIDASGKIYVADGNANVFVFAAGASGNVAPIATIGGTATKLNGPSSVALDSAGRIYVLDVSPATTFQIAVFAAGSNGNIAPTRFIAGSNTLLNNSGSACGGIAADSAGNIYVANSGSTMGVNQVLVFSSSANGNVAPRQKVSGSNTKIEGFSCDMAL